MSGIRLAVLDDGLFVRDPSGARRPIAATFHRFVEAMARTGAFACVRYIVPVRTLRIWEVEPSLDPVDESLVEIIPTAFFSGIADYLLRAAYILPRNWPVIDAALDGVDLLWLRLPASNALLALAAAGTRGVPHFGWKAGSVADVARVQPRLLPLRLLARAIGSAYDAVTDLASETGPLITLDDQIFTSGVTEAEIAATRATGAAVRTTPPWIITWAGRMAAEKRVPDLVGAVRLLLDNGADVRLELIGDGPARPPIERGLAHLPRDRVTNHGYLGDRAHYMSALRAGDVFVHPSAAEGVPKALLDAMAGGLPIIAADAGAVRELLGDGERGIVVPAGKPRALADAIQALLDDPARRATLRENGLAWASAHTEDQQARNLVAWLRTEFPQLDWS